MRKGICALWLCIILAILLAVPAAAADTATLTITPDKTALTADGRAQQITYTVTVTPPPGKEIGVFSFRLKPSGDMHLPTAFKEGDQRVITYESLDLEYNINTDSGVFRTYEYTPESHFFAAVGSLAEKRMKDEAKILTITATVPAGSTGVYTLDADFTAAPDGSGSGYIGKVVSPPVSVESSGGAAGAPEQGAPGSSPDATPAPPPAEAPGGEPAPGVETPAADDPAADPAATPQAGPSGDTLPGDTRQEAALSAAHAADGAGKAPGVLAACLLCALALAAAICQFALPGGLVKLCSKNKHRNKERTKEESH